MHITHKLSGAACGKILGGWLGFEVWEISALQAMEQQAKSRFSNVNCTREILFICWVRV
jgi:hypothetical protein